MHRIFTNCRGIEWPHKTSLSEGFLVCSKGQVLYKNLQELPARGLFGIMYLKDLSGQGQLHLIEFCLRFFQEQVDVFVAARVVT